MAEVSPFSGGRDWWYDTPNVVDPPPLFLANITLANFKYLNPHITLQRIRVAYW